MTNSTSHNDHGLSISEVERDTGLSKDTLRMWERRYGFPHPARDTNGERRYDVAQVQKLRTLKRLIDAGKRPGKLMRLSLADLSRLGSQRPADTGERTSDDAHPELIKLLQTRDVVALQRYLSQMLMRQGLQQFLLATIAPMNSAVGEAWFRGDLTVFDEHVYTEQVHALLRNVILNLPRRMDAPKVLLTTLPQEQHSIGLLMVEALLAAENAQSIALGTQTPVSEIAAATTAHRADIVGLSFSAGYSTRDAAAGIATLRRMLAPAVALWVGGRLVARLKNVPEGVRTIATLEELQPALRAWRNAHPPPAT